MAARGPDYFELDPNYTSSASTVENNSSATGFQGSSDMVDRMARFAVPDHALAPYLLDAQMKALQASIPAAGMLSNQEQYDALEFAEGHVPTAARHAAVHRVGDYRVLPDDPVRSRHLCRHPIGQGSGRRHQGSLLPDHRLR